jgi:DNA invertase Pin-like site-specific DNA recombinase
MRELGIPEKYIFIDKQSGKTFDRPQYQSMKLIIREGDLIYIDALDRLGRDYDGIIREWKHITRELSADIIVLENESLFDSRKFKTMGDLGKLLEDQFLSMLSYLAEQERKKTKQRQKEGIEVAINNGVKFGRPKIEVTDHFRLIYNTWKSREISAAEGMRQLGYSKNTFYRRVREHEETL